MKTQKNTVRTLWVGVIALGIGLGIAGWHFRRAITGAIQVLSLPGVHPPPAGTMRFAVIGDYGSGSPMERDVELMIRTWAPDFIGTLGDNDYPDGTAETIDDRIGKYYRSYIEPYKGRHGPGANKNRFFPIPGHRDWDNDELRPYLDYFTLPGNERYYDVVWGPVHLFLLDTDEREPDGATEDSIQGRWLEHRLKTSNAPWKLVFAHHAPYTSHSVPATSRMRWPFKAWGADAVLSGYYHIYERLQVDGMPYFVNGAGGSWVSHFGNIDNNSKFRYNEEFGAMIIEASATRITFRFVNRRGRVVDEYSIEKNQVGNKYGVVKGVEGVSPVECGNRYVRCGLPLPHLSRRIQSVPEGGYLIETYRGSHSVQFPRRDPGDPVRRDGGLHQPDRGEDPRRLFPPGR